MFNKKFEERMAEWKHFRGTLETSNDPMNEIISYYNHAPLVTIQADPWEQSTWPNPWELLEDNVYCPFIKILAICYTLQLTERFSHCQFKIHITQDKDNIRYLLTMDDQVIGYNSTVIFIEDLPNDVMFKKTYAMSSLQ